MNISVLTVFKDLYEPFVSTSLIGSAQKSGKVSFDIDTFFSFVSPKERIDAPVFGHGAGMLIKPNVVKKAITEKEQKFGKALKIFFSPQGKKLTQSFVKNLSERAQKQGHVMLLPARYEGMDSRVEEQYADEIVSLGDFVLMGGDIPAMALIEAILRYVPGVVGKQESVEQDSFSNLYVDYPSFTEPVEWEGKKVPDVIRSGNHGAVDEWRKKHAVEKTVKDHFEWLQGCNVPKEEKKVIQKHIPSHYVALMHTDVVIKDGPIIGNSSVTSIDLHDIARSSKTYGIKQYGIITPLIDQQKIVKTLLGFWQSNVGLDYNKSRHSAVKSVQLHDSLDAFMSEIEKIEGQKPIIVATSARKSDCQQLITYHDQHEAWKHNRPVLFIFGTAKGLSDDMVKRADYLLLPIEGFTNFNHLSVRSAVAVILDRWLGINSRQVEGNLSKN